MENKEDPRKNSSGASWLAVLIGLLLIPVNIFWITVVEVRWYTLDGTSLPLFITPIFILFVICLINMGVRRMRSPISLSRSDLTVIYVMVVVSGTLAGHDMLQNMFGAITHPFYFANEENQYQKLFFRYLPDFLLVTDQDALKDFYAGNANPFSSGLWRAWVLPLSMWGIFITVLLGMMLSVNIILRRAWTQNEKLVFPLIQLPVAMAATADGGGVFKNKAFWGGFTVAAFLTMLNGLHFLFPSVPQIEVIKQYVITHWFQTSPWNAVGHTTISMYPFAIGLAFFLPLDLSFSCWFFFVLRKIFQIVGRTQGWDGATNAGFPFFPEQAAGAWIGLGLVIVWGTRKYLKGVWLQIMGWAQEEEPGEARYYRIAIGFIVIGLLFLTFWSMLLNMQWWVALIFFGVYFLLSITITRVRAELGTPHEIYFVNPHNILVTLFGTTSGTAAAMTPFSMAAIASMYWFNRGMRCHPMPNIMESFKMAESGRVRYGQMIGVVVLSLAAGLAATYWANLYVTYDAGATSKALGFKWWLGTESYRDRLQSWMIDPRKVDFTNIGYMIGGLVMVFALKSFRAASVAFPFHPAGYALAVSYAMDYFWFAFFLSWAIKSLIIRYGGMKTHNLVVPFFLGLILGDFVMGSIWAIIGPVFGIQTYKVFI